MSTTARLPTIFFGHGNPMNAIERNAYTEGWARLAAAIPRPKAARAGEGPPSAGKALGFGVLAFALNAVLGFAAFSVVKGPVGQLAVFAVTSWVALMVARSGWPALWRVLLAYGFAARVPVLIVMFLSIFGGWDTHYSKPRPDFPAMGPWGLFFWTALLPQLSIWIWMTIAAGMIFGAIAVAVRRGATLIPAP